MVRYQFNCYRPLGFMLVISGMTYGAYVMNVPALCTLEGAIVLLGLGILTGVQATSNSDHRYEPY